MIAGTQTHTPVNATRRPGMLIIGGCIGTDGWPSAANSRDAALYISDRALSHRFVASLSVVKNRFAGTASRQTGDAIIA